MFALFAQMIVTMCEGMERVVARMSAGARQSLIAGGLHTLKYIYSVFFFFFCLFVCLLFV